MITEQEERNQLLESFLERYYFDSFRNPGPKYEKILELYIKSQCPSNCSYCYLAKHGKELYPYELQNEENILKNLGIIIDWYITNRFKCAISLFSGEIICSGLAFKIFDIMLEKWKDTDYRPSAIMFPENADFIHKKPELMPKVDEYIQKFTDLDIEFTFSLSVDGKYMDENRSRADRPHNFYENVIGFASHHYFAFHPMVSAYNIEKWKDNYDWWNGPEVPSHVGDRMMTLEVRNDDWTEEKITQYLEFLDHVINTEFERKAFGDKERFARRIVQKENYPNKGYDMIALPNFFNDSNLDNNGIGCSIKNALSIRVGDLAIVPCHRLSYEQFITGKLLTENNKIVGFEGGNWEILSAILSWNRATAHKCSKCEVNKWCMGPCFGSNFESTNEIFITPQSVCNLFRVKIMFLIMKYYDMGLFPYFEKLLSEKHYKDLLKFKNDLEAKFEQDGTILSDRINAAKRDKRPI